jgi:excinuclease UvrABC ATPase subunit
LDKDKLIDWDKSLAEGAIRHPEYGVGMARWKKLKISGFFDMNKPLKYFSQKELDKLLYSEKVPIASAGFEDTVYTPTFEGVVTAIKRLRLSKRSTPLSTTGRDTRFFKLKPCSTCHGSRLNEQARLVKINGKTIADLASMPLTELKGFLESVEGPVAQPLVKKTSEMLGHLIDIGVGYLSLNRPVGTLSGGEANGSKWGSSWVAI